jgi:hypothetical protein
MEDRTSVDITIAATELRLPIGLIFKGNLRTAAGGRSYFKTFGSGFVDVSLLNRRWAISGENRDTPSIIWNPQSLAAMPRTVGNMLRRVRQSYPLCCVTVIHVVVHAQVGMSAFCSTLGFQRSPTTPSFHAECPEEEWQQC